MLLGVVQTRQLVAVFSEVEIVGSVAIVELGRKELFDWAVDQAVRL